MSSTAIGYCCPEWFWITIQRRRYVDHFAPGTLRWKLGKAAGMTDDLVEGELRVLGPAWAFQPQTGRQCRSAGIGASACSISTSTHLRRVQGSLKRWLQDTPSAWCDTMSSSSVSPELARYSIERRRRLYWRGFGRRPWRGGFQNRLPSPPRPSLRIFPMTVDQCR